MASRKNVAKSIRISEELHEYIMACPGNGFNEKFENVILEAKAGEAQRKEALMRLEKQIAESRHELDVLFEKKRYLEEYFRIILRMQHDLHDAQEKLQQVTNLDKEENTEENENG